LACWSTGILVQLSANQVLMCLALGFEQALPPAVIVAARSNYLINNLLTFRF
jgi:dolichol-phosphate mannosyltransferase